MYILSSDSSFGTLRDTFACKLATGRKGTETRKYLLYIIAVKTAETKRLFCLFENTLGHLCDFLGRCKMQGSPVSNPRIMVYQNENTSVPRKTRSGMLRFVQACSSIQLFLASSCITMKTKPHVDANTRDYLHCLIRIQ